ncbi:MAG: hypothetical protein ACK4K2_08170 [Dehalococcoidia bacterium]
MRGIFVAVIAILMLASSGVYAAGIPTVSVKRLGGTGSLNVLSPVNYTVEATPQSFNTSSQVTQYKVRWFPTAGTGYYLIQVVLLNGAGTLLGNGQVTLNLGSIGTWREDTVSLSAPVSIANIATAKVNIVFRGPNP